MKEGANTFLFEEEQFLQSFFFISPKNLCNYSRSCMFTGIVTHLGSIKEKRPGKLVISVPADLFPKLISGMSVVVNGICLTATNLKDPDVSSIYFMPESQ